MSMLLRGLRRISHPLVVLVGAGVFAGFLLFVLPSVADNPAYPAGVSLPDLRFSYTPQQLYDIAAELGFDGRAAYVRGRLTYDLAFPLAYGLFMATALSFLVHYLWPEYIRLHGLPALPLLAMFADLGENAFVAWVMTSYPQIQLLPATLAAALTATKWIAISLAMLALAVALLGLVVDWLRRRGPRAGTPGAD